MYRHVWQAVSTKVYTVGLLSQASSIHEIRACHRLTGHRLVSTQLIATFPRSPHLGVLPAFSQLFSPLIAESYRPIPRISYSLQQGMFTDHNLEVPADHSRVLKPTTWRLHKPWPCVLTANGQ